MSHGHTKIPSKGVCIYCKRADTPLSDEHIVPLSLGGQHVIDKASCVRCARITSKFEGDVARELWGDARTSYNAPSRRKKRRNNKIALSSPSFHGSSLTVPVGDYPAPFVFYKMSQAGFLQGLSEEQDISHAWTLVTVVDEERLKRFEQKHPGRLTAKFRHVPDSFARLLAKIGYGQALCSLDLADFNPVCLPFILGEKKNLSYIVGGRTSPEERMPDIGYCLRSHLIGTPERSVIISEVRLLADSATPTYHVVVGDVTGAGNVRKVNEKLNAASVAEMTGEPISTPPPDSLHWIPRRWPLPNWGK